MVFRTIQEVRQKAEQGKGDYNWRRPHSSLGYKTPMELLKEPENSDLYWVEKRRSLQPFKLSAVFSRAL
ncbi:integrase core domain-containing protein [Fodinibius sediminis]|uniref:integrase core domain-containing protein n=1 Tax=Fodinibius sediminis TaxID=1214077 RepID=UPI003313B3F0